MSREGLPQLVMRRPNLDGLPQLLLPTGYQLRCFQDGGQEGGQEGDQEGWNEVMELAFEWEPGQADFETMMLSDSAYTPERVKVAVTAQGQVVATASCWPAARFDDDHRTLHYVATHPDHRGQRLGFQVSLAAMYQAAAEGGRSMVLLTDDFRDAAIKTYLRMDFVPLCMHMSHAPRWRLIQARLGTSVPVDE